MMYRVNLIGRMLLRCGVIDMRMSRDYLEAGRHICTLENYFLMLAVGPAEVQRMGNLGKWGIQHE